ncbi:MAG: TniQ family protein [Micromonosporaceae bacterium]|nr:TniQ family protein [Micromonosporaceae bacterium]
MSHRPVPLPRSLAPLHEESLAGFLLRLAFRLGLSPARLTEAVGLSGASATGRVPIRFLLAFDTDIVDPFTVATRLDSSEAQALTLATVRSTYPPVDPGFRFHRGYHAPPTRTINTMFAQERWILARTSRYCPDCLAGDGSTIQHHFGGAWNKLWHLPVAFACPTHHRLLEYRCPACDQPAMARRPGNGLITSPTVSDLHPAACRNPDSERLVCGWRLDTPTSPASDQNLPALLALQYHLLHRLRHDEPVTSVGLPATPAQYFIDLRILACLITVSWPAAGHLVNDRRQADRIDAHATATRRHVEQVRRDALLARDHALYDTPPADTAACAALLGLADSITHASDPSHARDLLDPLLHTVPDTHRSWIKQFLRGQGVSSPGLRTTLGPAVGAAHIAGPIAVASRTINHPAPTPRSVRFDLRHIPQRIPTTWIDSYFAAFTDLPSRLLHHVIAARLARMVLGAKTTNTDLADAVVPLGMARVTTTTAITIVANHLAGTARQSAFDQAIDALADHLETHLAPTDYGKRRTVLATWSIPPADWAEITDRLPTSVQTACGWRRVTWDDPKQLLATVWIWYQATSGDLVYNPHMDRDRNARGRRGPATRFIHRTWNRLVDHVDPYGQLRDRIGPYLDQITTMIDTDQPLDA